MAYRVFSWLRPIIFTCILVTVATHSLIGQDDKAPFSRSAVYLEAGGQGVLYSINYDYRLTPQLSLRTGFSSWSLDGFFFDKMQWTAFPIMLNYLTGQETSHFELGVGLMPVIVSAENFLGFSTPESTKGTVVGSFTVGYRAQPRDGGFVFRIGLTPIFNFSVIQLWAGLSFGVAF